jgi:hypothetical protein
MTKDQRENHRKKRILEYAERIGNINRTTRTGLKQHSAATTAPTSPTPSSFRSSTDLSRLTPIRQGSGRG